MKKLIKKVNAEHEIKGSKFLVFFEPFSIEQNVRIRQEELRTTHFKCVHVVYASRVLNEFNQIVENQSDDGEPKGSSALPILNVLRGNDLINCVCYVVRYFGGTLLGVGGLVRAYSLGIKLAIDNAIKDDLLIDYIKKDSYLVEVEYSLINKFIYILDSLNISYKKDFLDYALFTLYLSNEDVVLLQDKIKDLRLMLVKI